MPKDIQLPRWISTWAKAPRSKLLFMPRESLLCQRIFNPLVELEEIGLFFINRERTYLNWSVSNISYVLYLMFFFSLYTICNHVIYYVITISLCIIFIFHLHFVTILFLYRRYFSSMGDGTLVIYSIFIYGNNLLEKFRSNKT